MKKALLISYFILAVHSVPAQNLFQRIYAAGNPDDNVSLYDAAPVSAGGYIATGGITSLGTHNNLVMKLDANGQVLWSKQIGQSPGRQDAYKAGEAVGGGYYFLGVSAYNALEFGKVDANGNLLFNKLYSADVIGPYFQFPSIRQLNAGGFIISASLSDQGGMNRWFYFLKTDASGNIIDSMTFRKSLQSKDLCYDVETTNDGGFIGVGIGYFGVCLVKLDSNLNQVWTHEYYIQALATSVAGYSICKTSDGGFAIAGSYGNHIPFIIKILADGSLVWAKRYGNYHYDPGTAATSIIEADDGGLVCTGTVALDFASERSYSYLMKVKDTGSFLWAEYFAEEDHCYTSYMRPTPDLGFIISVSEMDYNNTSMDQGYLIKTDSAGTTDCERTPLVLMDSNIVLLDTISSIMERKGYSSTVPFFDNNRTVDYSLDCSIVLKTKDEVRNEALLNIFPNPAHQSFSITLNPEKIGTGIQSSINNGQLKIFDVTGRVVQEQKINSQISTFNFQLAAGVYFVKVEAGERVYTEKLVVE